MKGWADLPPPALTGLMDACKNFGAKGNHFLIFLAEANLMSHHHIWLSTELKEKYYFWTVMIFLKSQHDMIYKKLNCTKIVKLFGGWKPPFFGRTILKLTLLYNQYQIIFSGIFVKIRETKALWIQSNNDHCYFKIFALIRPKKHKKWRLTFSNKCP